MRQVDYLIVGGSAAGTTAAEVIRGLKTEASITIINEEDHEQYSRVLLPNYLKHKVTREEVFLKKPEWYIDKNIELVKGVKAEQLVSESKRVKVSNGEEYQYGKLLLAIGGAVVNLNIPGSDLDNILYLRTIEDADKLVKVSSQSQSAVIVGGGFVSLDFATGFRANGVEEVTVLVRHPYFWSKHLDEASSQIISSLLEKNNVHVVAIEDVERFLGNGKVGTVVTKSGKRFEADVVGVGIGIKTDFGWISDTGLAIDKGIVTNEYLETNLQDVYAAGDCAQFHDVFFEREHVMGNWVNATTQGLVVAKSMCGQRTVFETISSYSDTFFDGSYSFIGVTDETFADRIIVRGSAEAGKMARIFVKEYAGLNPDGSDRVQPCTRIVGASIINDPAEVAPITSAIRSKADISGFIEKISDLDFDLKDIIVS